MTTAIVILNWNGKKYLEEFVPIVLKHSNFPSVSVYVADNNSIDDSVAFLKTNFPTVKLICLQQNYGYANGYNEAIKQLTEDIIVLLNSDIEVTQNWLNPVLNLFEQDKNIAAIQPKILDYNNRNTFEYAGASGGFIDKLGYPFCRGRIFNELEKDNNQYNTAQPIFWATGACLFVRREAYLEAGQLDGDFFAHMEEIDLCWRIKNLGYQVWVQPNSVVYHVGGGTLNKINPKKTYLNFRNNLFLISKNAPKRYILFLILARLVLDGIAGLKFLIEGQASHCWAVVKAHFAFYAKAVSMLKKRNNKKFKFQNKVYSEIAVTSVVWKFYIEKKKKFSEL
ncbi:MAG: glycosyltransferase family 2 protein [Bacteroidota bacterium]